MGTRKIIYWDESNSHNNDAPSGHGYAVCHILVGYNQGMLADLLEMADTLRKTFPQATNDTIKGGMVRRSDSVDGHTIIAWSGIIKRKAYRGWTQKPEYAPEYYW